MGLGGRPQRTGVFILLKIAHPVAISTEPGKQSCVIFPPFFLLFFCPALLGPFDKNSR